MKTNEQESGETVAGTNLTPIAEYAKTALAVADLRSRYKGLVFELDSAAKIREAKKNVAEVRCYRTALEDERKRIKQPALDRCRLIDDEAKRLTAELRELEDPMKAQIDAKEAEIEAERIRVAQAEQDRVDGHRAAIQRMRDFPLSLQGKPSSVIETRIADFVSRNVEEGNVGFHKFEEFADEAKDAYIAAVASARDLLQRQWDHEAEQEKIRQERAELDRMRAENERLQREAQERIEADARKAREEAEAQLRAEQAERDRIAAEERAERERIEVQQRADRDAEEAAERARLAEVAKAQREQQEKLDRERREHEAQVERDRIANLSLVEAANAVVAWYTRKGAPDAPECVWDLAAVLGKISPKDADEGKRTAAKPVKTPRKQA